MLGKEGLARFTSWHVGVAAEAVAASVFARCGLDVSVQYGANQPEYDLIVANGDKMLKVSVKGSKDGSWGLTQSLLKDADYHLAIDHWLERHSSRTIFCLVQYKGVKIDEIPRIYLATPGEIAERLHGTANGRGDTILFEHHQWGPRAHAANTVDCIPDTWKFSEQRLIDLIDGANDTRLG